MGEGGKVCSAAWQAADSSPRSTAIATAPAPALAKIAAAHPVPCPRESPVPNPKQAPEAQREYASATTRGRSVQATVDSEEAVMALVDVARAVSACRRWSSLSNAHLPTFMLLPSIDRTSQCFTTFVPQPERTSPTNKLNFITLPCDEFQVWRSMFAFRNWLRVRRGSEGGCESVSRRNSRASERASDPAKVLPNGSIRKGAASWWNSDLAGIL